MPAPNQNWTVSNQRPRPLMAPPTGQSNLPPGLNGGDAGYTRQVQDNELASTQMEELGRGDNRVLQQARQRGVMAGASRGGINSNLAAAGGESAWLDAAGDVAMQQAGAFGTAAGQNLDSLRQQRISAEGNAAQIQSADISAGASMYNSDNDLLSAREGRDQDRDLTLSGRDFQRGEREGDQSFRSGESQRDRDFTTGRDETQFGYERRLNEDRYGYQQDAEDAAATRDGEQYLFRNLIDNPEEYDQELLQEYQSFWDSFRSRRNRPKGP